MLEKLQADMIALERRLKQIEKTLAEAKDLDQETIERVFRQNKRPLQKRSKNNQ